MWACGAGICMERLAGDMPSASCSPSLSVSAASRSDRCIRVLNAFLFCPSPPPAFGMNSFTVAILITQVLGYVLALVGMCLCIMGESHASVSDLSALTFPFFFFFLTRWIFISRVAVVDSQENLVESTQRFHIACPFPAFPTPTASLSISHHCRG